MDNGRYKSKKPQRSRNRGGRLPGYHKPPCCSSYVENHQAFRDMDHYYGCSPSVDDFAPGSRNSRKKNVSAPAENTRIESSEYSTASSSSRFLSRPQRRRFKKTSKRPDPCNDQEARSSSPSQSSVASSLVFGADASNFRSVSSKVKHSMENGKDFELEASSTHSFDQDSDINSSTATIVDGTMEKKKKKENYPYTADETQLQPLLISCILSFSEKLDGDPKDIVDYVFMNLSSLNIREDQFVIKNFSGIGDRKVKIAVTSKKVAKKIQHLCKKKCFKCGIVDLEIISEEDDSEENIGRMNESQKIMRKVQEKIDSSLSEHSQKENSVLEKIEKVKREENSPNDWSLKDFKIKRDLDIELDELRNQKIEFERQVDRIKKKLLHAIENDEKVVVNQLKKDIGSEMEKFRHPLPIYSKRTLIRHCVRQNRVSIIVADTGSGKSTQIPQYLMEVFPDSTIVCTQPRKIAAISLAERVSHETLTAPGEKIGYMAGMARRCQEDSKVIYMVDSTLLKECIKDPVLSKYACVIVDEAHERSLSTDVVIGMLKRALTMRSDLKVVITSATIDPAAFVRYFREFRNSEDNNCPVLQVPGRTFPVEIHYSTNGKKDRRKDYFEAVVGKVKEICASSQDGDILAFLTTPAETEKAAAMIGNLENVKVLQLHGRLQPKDQQAVFEPTPKNQRKVVFATNSAETSVTIDGVKFCIDCGFVKEKKFDPNRGTSSLEVGYISKSSAKQRAGRVGRTGPGVCFRMYGKEDYDQMAEMFIPEILRVNLGQTLLYLMSAGIDDVLNFEFMDPPEKSVLNAAFTSLLKLGAIDDQAHLSDLGQKMSNLPLEPRLSKFIFSFDDFAIQEIAMEISACIAIGNIFFRIGSEDEKRAADVKKVKYIDQFSDCLTYLNVYREWSMIPMRQKGPWCAQEYINGKCMKYVSETIKELKSALRHGPNIAPNRLRDVDDDQRHQLVVAYCKCFSDNIAIYTGHERFGYYAPSINDYIFIHPASSVILCDNPPKYIVFEYVLKTTRPYAINVCALGEDFIAELMIDDEILAHCRSKILTKISLDYFGSTVKRLFLRHKTKITIDGQSDFSLVQKDPWFKLSVFCKCDFEEEQRARIENFYKEHIVGITHNFQEFPHKNSSVRLCLSSGAEIREILMPGQYVTVSVQKVEDMDVVAMRKELSHFGTVCRCIKFNNAQSGLAVFRRDRWGIASFATKLEAEFAVRETKNRESLVLEPIVDKPKVVLQGEKFPIRITWPRRKCTGIGYVLLEDSLDFARAQMALSCSSISCMVSKKNPEKEFILKNLSETSTTQDLINKIDPILKMAAIQYTKIFAVLEKSFENSDEELTYFENIIREKIESYHTSDGYTLELAKPKPGSLEYVMKVYVNKIHEGYRVLRRLKSSPIYLPKRLVPEVGRHILNNNRLTTCEADILMEITIVTRIYDALRESLDELLHQKFSATTLTFKALKSGRMVARIAGTDYFQALRVRALLETQTAGDEIICRTKPLNVLLTKKGEIMLKDLQMNLEKKCERAFYISIEKTRMEIRLYGSEPMKTEAKLIINKYLSNEVGKSICDNSLQLMPPSYPKSALKLLLKHYDYDINLIVAAFDGCNELKIDFLHRRLDFCGTENAFQALVEMVKKILSSQNEAPQFANGDCAPDCAACCCPTDAQSVYCAEACGHYYCIECIKMQIDVAIRDGQYPLLCAAENCGQRLTYNDLESILLGDQNRDKTNDVQKLEPLLKSAVASFMARNVEAYKYCFTPDCHGIYEKTDAPAPHVCELCRARHCSSCGEPFHDGVTCAAYAAMKRDHNLDVEVWMKNHESRKCPTCGIVTELIDGCNHVLCHCGSHFCFKCGFLGTDDRSVYSHMRASHGQIYN